MEKGERRENKTIIPDIGGTTRKIEKERQRKEQQRYAGRQRGTERDPLSRNGFANLGLTEGEYLYMVLALFLPVCSGCLSYSKRWKSPDHDVAVILTNRGRQRG